MNWEVLTGVVALIAVVVSFFQWHVSQNYKRLDQRFEQLQSCLETVSTDLEKAEMELGRLRDEVHRDFVRSGEMDKLHTELRQDFDKIFRKLSGLSRELNQMIGMHNRRVQPAAAIAAEEDTLP